MEKWKMWANASCYMNQTPGNVVEFLSDFGFKQIRTSNMREHGWLRKSPHLLAFCGYSSLSAMEEFASCAMRRASKTARGIGWIVAPSLSSFRAWLRNFLHLDTSLHSAFAFSSLHSSTLAASSDPLWKSSLAQMFSWSRRMVRRWLWTSLAFSIPAWSSLL